MKKKYVRVGYTAAQKQELWERRKKTPYRTLTIPIFRPLFQEKTECDFQL